MSSSHMEEGEYHQHEAYRQGYRWRSMRFHLHKNMHVHAALALTDVNQVT